MGTFESRLGRCLAYFAITLGTVCALLLGAQYLYGGNPLGLIGTNRHPGDPEALLATVVSILFIVVGLIIYLMGRKQPMPTRRLRRPPPKDWT